MRCRFSSQFDCDLQAEVVTASKSVKILELSEIMVLHLMRFSYGSQGSTKLHKTVHFPLELLVGREFLASPTSEVIFTPSFFKKIYVTWQSNNICFIILSTSPFWFFWALYDLPYCSLLLFVALFPWKAWTLTFIWFPCFYGLWLNLLHKFSAEDLEFRGTFVRFHICYCLMFIFSIRMNCWWIEIHRKFSNGPNHFFYHNRAHMIERLINVPIL